jgi:von Willebrand factor A domain-containing protein 7
MKLPNMRTITPRPICRSLSCVLITVFLLFAFLCSSRAFFPTNLRSPFGLLGKTHESITTEAIIELDKEFFDIIRLKTPMTDAINEIVAANAKVDEDQKTAAKHFDGESFDQGNRRIFNLRFSCVEALQKNNAEGARFQLGSALHTIQDFYSHSNWVELGNTAPHPKLGLFGEQFNVNRLLPTCRDCQGGNVLQCPDCNTNIIDRLLTSGYYPGEDPPFDAWPPGKCNHGGPFDAAAKNRVGAFREGINKDSSDCLFSPHASWHEEAARLAKEATKKFIRDISRQVTPDQLKLLLGAGAGTFTLVVDTTGNGAASTLANSTGTTEGMGSIIEAVKEQAIQIVNARLGTDQEPSKYVLVPFNDPGVGPVTVTTDVNVFKNALNALSAHGGDDCPELSQEGMLEALAASDEGGELFMFTDASSKDSALAGTVCSLATSKDIRIYPILFGTCSSSIDPSYIREANHSGGQLFSLSSSEAGSITQLADFIVRSNAVNLLLINDTFNGISRTYTVPVDSTMTRIIFSISGTTSVVVRRPTGAVVQGSDPDVRLLSLSGGTIYSITNPVVEEWNVHVDGTGDVSVEVSGESSLNLSSFRFVEPGGAGAHPGFFPIDGQPLAGQEGMVDAVMSGNFNTAHFSFRSHTGAVLKTLALSPVPETADEFFGQFMPPTSSFRVYVTGQDMTGANYQRLLSASIQPQTVKIDAPMSQDLQPGLSLSYTFKVHNFGLADRFNFTASDDKGFLAGITPSSFALGHDETKEVTVTLRTPANTLVGTSDTLTVNVTSNLSNTRNFAVVESVVTPPSQLANVSTRAFVQTGDNVMIGGFIVQGTEPKRVIIRAIGPELAQYGVPNPLFNPTLELHDGTGALIASNNNWVSTVIGGIITSNQVHEIQASGYAPGDPLESAIIADLPAGNYTAVVRGVNNTTGVALVEVYNLSPETNSILGNISARSFVQTGDNVMIGGFMIQGTKPKRVIIRAIGPELTQYGVPDALANAALELHDETGALIASNNNWASTIIGGIITSNQVHEIQASCMPRATQRSRQSSRICQRATTRRSSVV